MESNPRNKSVLASGMIAIAIGGLFLLQSSGLIHFDLWRFWPLILVILGIKGLFEGETGCKRGQSFGSGIMLLWGVILLGASFGVIQWAHMWPWFLIGLGLLLVWQSYRPKPMSLPLSEGAFHPDAVFSSIEKTVTDQNFTHGTVSAVFGSIEIDFIQANIAGDSAVLELNAVFGSVEIRVPLNWNIVIEAGAVFGSCENRTRAPLPQSGPMKTLYVRGGTVFGSVEVKN